MKLLFCSLFLFVSLGFFFNRSSQENRKGVYVISLESKGYGKDGKSFKFPDDSIFVNNEFALEKVMRLELFDYNGISTAKESVDAYFIINLKKGLYKDLERSLEKETESIPWIELREKKLGFNFYGKWYENETYKMKDTIYNGKKVKKIKYVSAEHLKYEILLQQNLPKNPSPVFFGGLEDKFKGDLLKMIITYPDKQGSFIFTKKFVQIKNQEVLWKLDKYSQQ